MRFIDSAIFILDRILSVKYVDFVLYEAERGSDQKCRVFVSEPYDIEPGHRFDFGQALDDLGVPQRSLRGSGNMRVFGRILMRDYSIIHFDDAVVKDIVVREMKRRDKARKTEARKAAVEARNRNILFRKSGAARIS
jgi:hypothetical protein